MKCARKKDLVLQKHNPGNPRLHLQHRSRSTRKRTDFSRGVLVALLMTKRAALTPVVPGEAAPFVQQKDACCVDMNVNGVVSCLINSGSTTTSSYIFFFFKQKTAYEITR